MWLQRSISVPTRPTAEKAAGLQADLQHRFGFLTRERAEGGSGHRNAARAREEGTRSLSAAPPSTAVPVVVSSGPQTALQEVQAYVVPALGPIETALIVLIVTIFILFQKEDLRDRLIRLMGARDLHRTTTALDEGARRLSSYFLSQFMVNCGFGAVIWVGLFLLGVPSPGLWGILAGLLRFIPYVGPVVAALGPLALAAAVDPGWHMVLWVALLFVVAEPIVGYGIEPLLYGRSTGLSPVSVVVAAMFWTWIWGPIGLVLSMPITLLLVVLGRHIPAFEVFDILLGDRPALSPAETFYQRALAGHTEEAVEHGEAVLESLSLAAYYDDVVLGGLRLAAADLDRGAVERSALPALCETVLEILEAFADYEGPESSTTQVAQLALAPDAPERDRGCDDLHDRTVICVPGRGPLDAAVAAMMRQLLLRAGCEVLERARVDMSEEAGSALEHGGGGTICVLGLFNDRSFGRIQRMVKRSDHRPLLVGVCRTTTGTSPSEIAPGLLPSLAAVCEALHSGA